MNLRGVVALALVLAEFAGAQAPTSALAGTVRDTLGHPLRQVIVTVDSTTLTAISDDSGRFHIKGITPGINGFALRRIGFSPIDFETTLDPNKTLVLDIRMKQLTTLDAVTVTTTGPVALHRDGFYERQRMGLGTFLPPAKIDSLSNLPTGSMMLAQSLARGVRRACPPNRGGNACDVQLRSAACRWLFVDGKQVDGVFDEVVSPSEIAAIEIYDRIMLVPAQFQGRLPETRGGGRMMSRAPAGCGAIVVWTKSRAAP